MNPSLLEAVSLPVDDESDPASIDQSDDVIIIIDRFLAANDGPPCPQAKRMKDRLRLSLILSESRIKT